MRVGIYARTSKAEGGDETSVPVQIADCRDRAEQEGWTVVEEYTDPGISGWKRKTRPAYERLFADAASGRIDAVLARDYERLLRNDKEGQRWLDLFESHGFADFRFADEADINLRRARDRKDWKERVAAAVYYSDRLSEKVRRTKQARKVTGTYTGGGPTFGYRVSGGGPEIDPEQAAVVHDAVTRLARGDSAGTRSPGRSNPGTMALQYQCRRRGPWSPGHGSPDRTRLMFGSPRAVPKPGSTKQPKARSWLARLRHGSPHVRSRSGRFRRNSTSSLQRIHSTSSLQRIHPRGVMLDP